MDRREATALPKLVLSHGSRLLRHIALDRPRLTIGRRAFNDLMLDDLTVSGEHAVIQCHAQGCTLLDLGSHNGTRVNGIRVTQTALAEGDQIEIGVYNLAFVLDRESQALSATPFDPQTASLSMLSGPNAPGTLALDRPILAISDGSGQMASLAFRRGEWQITHLEGAAVPMVNGESIGLAATPLHHEDLIELGGTTVRFLMQPHPS